MKTLILVLTLLSFSAHSSHIDILCDGEDLRSNDKFTLIGSVEETIGGLEGKLTFNLNSSGESIETDKSTYKVQGLLEKIEFSDITSMDTINLSFKNENSEFNNLEIKINNLRRERSILSTKDNGNFYSKCMIEKRS